MPACRSFLLKLILALCTVGLLQAQSPTGPGEGEGPSEGPVLTLENDVFVTSTQSRVTADFTCARVLSLGSGAMSAPAHAGESFSNWEMGWASSYASINDDFAGADGHHWDTGVYVGTTWLDKWQLTLQVGTGEYGYAGGFLVLDNTYVDLVAMYQVLPWLAVGPFFEYSYLEFNSNYNVSGTREVFAGGLLASGVWTLGPGDLSATTALASMNKANVSDLFDSQETALAVQVDYGLPLGESFRLTPFAYYFTMLENDRPVDGHYWLGGLELTWQIREELAFTVGYDTYFNNDSYNEKRFTADLNYRF
jgi:hypothetical protein